MDLRLRDGERRKFAHPRGGTNPITARTVPPHDVIGEIINSNQAFIPIAVGPFGGFGSLFRLFIDDINTLPLPTFPTDRPNTARAAKLATNYCIPYTAKLTRNGRLRIHQNDLTAHTSLSSQALGPTRSLD
jgi:hypothetical protein